MKESLQAIASEPELVQFGRRLGAALELGTSIFLSGELGAGKTTLTRGIARGLGHEGAVKSPTYTLVEPYTDLAKPLYHFDLYRLGDPQELEFMGIRDYFDAGAIVVLEWPERGGAFLPVPDLEITIAVSAGARDLQLRGHSERGASLLAACCDGPG